MLQTIRSMILVLSRPFFIDLLRVRTSDILQPLLHSLIMHITAIDLHQAQSIVFCDAALAILGSISKGMINAGQLLDMADSLVVNNVAPLLSCSNVIRTRVTWYVDVSHSMTVAVY